MIVVLSVDKTEGILGAKRISDVLGAPALPAHEGVQFWHKADMLNALTNVRFWGQSGH
jgi:hypothetical protein